MQGFATFLLILWGGGSFWNLAEGLMKLWKFACCRDSWISKLGSIPSHLRSSAKRLQLLVALAAILWVRLLHNQPKSGAACADCCT
eukprot:1725556-Amphidinium_carterae.1